MTRWPICSLSLSPMRRESVSLPPPGGNGETKRIVRAGYCCATDVPQMSAARSKAATRGVCMKKWKRGVSLVSLTFFHSRGLEDFAPLRDLAFEVGGELLGRVGD